MLLVLTLFNDCFKVQPSNKSFSYTVDFVYIMLFMYGSSLQLEAFVCVIASKQNQHER